MADTEEVKKDEPVDQYREDMDRLLKALESLSDGVDDLVAVLEDQIEPDLDRIGDVICECETTLGNFLDRIPEPK